MASADSVRRWQDFEIDSAEKYNQYLCSREWAEKRRAVIERAKGVCERCHLGKVEEIHHLTYLRKYAEHLDDLQGLCSFCHEFIHGLSDFDPAKTKPIDEVLVDAFDSIRSPNSMLSGFEELDGWLGGFRASELIVLASRPSMGKSALALNIANNLIEQSKVLIFTPETASTSVAHRLLAIRGRVDLHRIRNSTLDEVEYESVMKEASRLHENGRLTVCDQVPLDFARIQSISRQKREQGGLDFIIVDYLNILATEVDGTREQQIGDTVRKLKQLAMALQVPVLCLAQIGRTVEQRDDKRPRFTDLRESGAIEEIADSVLFLHRSAAYDPEDRPGEADVIVAKQRNGPTGTVTLSWLSESLRFGNLAKIPDGGFFGGKSFFGGKR